MLTLTFLLSCPSPNWLRPQLSSTAMGPPALRPPQPRRSVTSSTILGPLHGSWGDRGGLGIPWAEVGSRLEGACLFVGTGDRVLLRDIVLKVALGSPTLPPWGSYSLVP